ncbi:hypothetical protein NEOLEDRAFT_1174188 [Neolentinus lepideus HHB14362 ss-1]|uniref:CoA-dependent acyltransferase n=1 Tax=Neolentinus lepideus HHB14362 ss-1 TaxID=1314782 RepID=A0A165W898_9AGAM|nr:hypothetical protein NEOLEDRAFT_1174188 [Neolentinus lepideus HHB14362 ss-1]
MESGLLSPPLTEADTPVDLDHTTLLQSLSVKDDPCQSPSRHERQLGDSELAFYLPSRQMGVNDMYLALEFRAVERVMRRSRVRVAWALLRLRHPLLASSVEMHDYHDVRFVYQAPESPDELLLDANTTLNYCAHPANELIDKYVNGPRTLSDSRLSYLTISQPGAGPSFLPTPPLSPSGQSDHSYEDMPSQEMYDYTVFMCVAHFIGDGMSVIDLSKLLLDILGSDKSTCQLEVQLRDEWHMRFGKSTNIPALPVAAEDRLPTLKGKFRRVAAKVDFLRDQQKNIGGQVFPRWQSKGRHISVRSVAFDAEKTAQILKKCKSECVSVSLVIFALCNMVWSRSHHGNKDLPAMMYSALSLRPYLKPAPPLSSDLFLAVGYFNVVLPSFIPKDSDEAKLFWHRARSARDQCFRTAKSQMLPFRSREMAHKRAEQARAWAVIDDTNAGSAPKLKEQPTAPADIFPKVPSATLLGISLLGNVNSLSDIAKAPLFEVKGMTPGVRQRAGGMLMFSFTFMQKLWIVVNWDELGYDREVFDTFWNGVVAGVDEFLC